MPVKILELSGKRWAIMPEREYKTMAARARRIRRNSGEGRLAKVLPELPPPDAHGNYPAVEYGRASLARKIIRARRQAGLDQAGLAGLASVKLALLERIEKGDVTPDARTIDRIHRALRETRKRTD